MAAGPRTLVVALTMMALAIFSAGTALAAGPEVLSPMDERAYREAFAASQRGDFEDAEAAMARVKDRALAGHLAFQKLMHPTGYSATYAELTAWLKTYGDQPGAERVYALAVKRKPAGATDPKPPAFMEVSRLWGRVESASSLAGGPASPDRGRAAREAYYSGDATRALALAPAAGERWVAGLAAWRLSRFEEARDYFRAVAIDEDQDDWLRAAGAFWAARASTKLGELDQAVAFLRMAARVPQTFYGMIAQRALELQGARLGAGPGDWRPALAGAITDYGFTRVTTEPARPAIEDFVRDDRRAHRATALMQIGRAADAGLELRAGLTLAKTPAERQQWQALVLTLNAPLTTAADAAPPPSARRAPSRRPPETYPAPELWPEGGFTLDKALVYALVWKESRFNSFAVSGAGAMGLMQVRPVAAARAAGDDKLLLNPMPLLDAPTNLRVGQDYFIWLMERALGGGSEAYDILRAIAAYNAGAGTVLNTIKKLGGGEVDTLLLIESLPALETRDYVEKVMVAYWTYKRRFGGETNTLDALARGERIIDIRLDR